MRILKTILLVLFCVTASAVPAFAYNTEYACKSEVASGFIYSGAVKKWDGVHFGANASYVIRGATDEDFETEVGKRYKGAVLVVSSVKGGQVLPARLFCSGYDRQGFTYCEGAAESMRFNKDTRRFLSIFASGYVLTAEELANGQDGVITPMMVIGKCKVL